TPFQVLIVDDPPLIRRGNRQLLQLDPAIHVDAEAGDRAREIELANRIEPDHNHLDLNIKVQSFLETLNSLRPDGVTPQIIIITETDSAI
ncbi:response regulator, partial [Salmonella enterica]|uniref:response regulator n=1 Tax=Salmonella enterica TaxID=28901 RepID=UPI003F19F824